MNEFITLGTLGTFGGMALVATLLTQVVKQFLKVDPKWITLTVSLGLVLLAQVLPVPLSSETLLIAACNWILVTGASIGLFEGGKSVGKVLGIGAD